MLSLYQDERVRWNAVTVAGTADTRRRVKHRPSSGVVALTAAALAAVLVACSQSAPPIAPAQAARDPIVVPLIHVGAGTVQRYVRATGTFFGEERTTVGAKVAGRIDAVYRDIADVVTPGTPLARVDPRDYELAVAERRRAFEQSLAQIGLESLPEGEVSIDALPAVERTRLQAANAQARYDRGQVLHSRTPPSMSDQEFADLKTAWEVAQADHRLAMLNSRAQLAEARTLQAQLASAEQRLTDTLLAVPRGERPPPAESDAATARSFEYIVTKRSISVGDFVAIGTPLFELIDPDPLKLRMSVPEREAPRVRTGQRARGRVDTESQAFEGQVARVNYAVDARTRTFEVEILVPNGERRLRAGSFARAEIEAEVATGVVLIPRTAVVTFAGVHKVFALKDDKALERPVTLGQEIGDQVEIERGLAVGDTIVAAPPADMVSGTPIRAAPPTEAK